MAFPLTLEEHDEIEAFITAIPEIIVAAALKHPKTDAVVFCPRPHRHSSSINFIERNGGKCSGDDDVWNCGFVTSHGRFVDRREAAQIVLATGQGTIQTHEGNLKQNLYSEDLWISEDEREVMHKP